MPSPFPGMNPYIEQPSVWPTFHHHLTAALYQALLPGLVDRYRARIGIRNYQTEVPLFTSIIREDHAEEYIEIRSRGNGKLVTLVDVVNPTNKQTTPGRTAYLEQRRRALSERSAVVEIDLLKQGQPILQFDRSGLPAHDYAVTVTRGSSPERYEVYVAPLQKRLPKFNLPLATDDHELVVDLQVAATRAFDQGQIASLLDYSQPLPVSAEFSDTIRKWIQEQLEQSC